jgi:hypothetical protein
MAGLNGNGNGQARFVDRAVNSSILTLASRGLMIVSSLLGSALLAVLVWLSLGVIDQVNWTANTLWKLDGRVIRLEEKVEGQGENIRRLNRSLGVPVSPQPSVPR